MIPFRKPRHRAGAVGSLNVLRVACPRAPRGTPRTPFGAPYDPRFNSHETSRRAGYSLRAAPEGPAALPSPWPCINLIRPGPPASSQKRVFCITPVFSVGTTGGSRPCPSARPGLQGRKRALRHVSCWLVVGVVFYVTPGYCPLRVRHGPGARHGCRPGMRGVDGFMRHARALCVSGRILWFVVHGRQARGAGLGSWVLPCLIYPDGFSGGL